MSNSVDETTLTYRRVCCWMRSIVPTSIGSAIATVTELLSAAMGNTLYFRATASGNALTTSGSIEMLRMLRCSIPAASAMERARSSSVIRLSWRRIVPNRSPVRFCSLRANSNWSGEMTPLLIRRSPIRSTFFIAEDTYAGIEKLRTPRPVTGGPSDIECAHYYISANPRLSRGLDHMPLGYWSNAICHMEASLIWHMTFDQ